MAASSSGNADVIRAEHLPAAYRENPVKQVLTLPDPQTLEYVEYDFSLKKYDQLGSSIWMAGRPYLPRALNIQRVLGREIIATSDISLHLVWTTGKIYIKPLPSYLVPSDFYEQNLQRSVLGRTAKKRSSVLGFLYTYLALLQTELDFAIAEKSFLIPCNLTWKGWQSLARMILSDYPSDLIHTYIHKRYKYGELRLSRLDKISRYLKGDLHHGWSALTESTRYNDFLIKYLSPIAAMVVYVVVLLSALQVGLATEQLAQIQMFQAAAVGFAIFSLLLPVVTIGLVLLVLLALFIVNFVKSVQVQLRLKRETGLSARIAPSP